MLHFCDSQVACYCITNRGSSDPFSDKITRKIFELTKANNFTIQISWLKTTENWKADALSRIKSVKNLQIEFSIPTDLLQAALNRLLDWQPNCDLFANFLNKKFEIYASWKADPFSIVSNAFLLDWSKYNCYIYCCSALVGRVLNQIKQQKVKNSTVRAEVV